MHARLMNWDETQDVAIYDVYDKEVKVGKVGRIAGVWAMTTDVRPHHTWPKGQDAPYKTKKESLAALEELLAVLAVH